MSSKSKSRKSVSFQSSSIGEVKAAEPAVTNVVVTPFKSSILLVPFHLPLILAFLYSGLLENPSKALVKGIPTLIAAQLAYGFVIVSSDRKASKKKSKSENNIPILLLGAVVISFLLSLPLFVVIILFGAPLYGLLLETYLLSVHLAFILFFPTLVAYKLDLTSFLSTFKSGSGDQFYPLLYKNQLVFAAIGGLLGAWFGVLPIPLDWDRDWQQWPITILIGGYVGSLLGGVISLPLSE